MAASYDEWRDALAHFWLDGAQAGEAVTLYLDDDDLSRVLPGETDDSLSRAVRSRLLLFSSSPFSRDLHDLVSWKKAGQKGPLPSLPTLALCILAGTRMAGEGDIRPTNYYHRLAQLICDNESRLPHAKSTLSAHFDDLIPVWKAASSWLEKLGYRSTIRSHRFYTRIGYPLSQAVIRRSDRYVLTQLWSAMGFGVGQPPSGKRILRDAAIWLDRPRGLNANLRSRILTGSADEELGELLHDVALEWDGQIYTTGGRKTQAATLEGWGSDEPHLAWALGPVDEPADFEAFHSGAIFESAGVIWRVEPRRIARLSHDPFSGRWREAALAIGEPQWVICGEQVLPAVKDFARGVFGSAVRERVKVRTLGQFKILQFDPILDRDKMSKALLDFERDTSPLTAEEFRSGSVRERSLRVRLANGLRLPTALGPNVYLSGGAPDLFYPTGVDVDTVTVTLDGESQVLERSGLALPLSQLHWLSAGRHEGDIDGLPFSYFQIDADEEIDGEVRLSADARSWLIPLSENGIVSGAAVLDASWRTCEATLLVMAMRGADETYLVGPQGQCRLIQEPPHSAIPRDGDVSPDTFCIERSRTEGWLVQFVAGEPTVTQIVPVPPDMTPADSVDWTLWASLRHRLSSMVFPSALGEVFDRGEFR